MHLKCNIMNVNKFILYKIGKSSQSIMNVKGTWLSQALPLHHFQLPLSTASVYAWMRSQVLGSDHADLPVDGSYS